MKGKTICRKLRIDWVCLDNRAEKQLQMYQGLHIKRLQIRGDVQTFNPYVQNGKARFPRRTNSPLHSSVAAVL